MKQINVLSVVVGFLSMPVLADWKPDAVSAGGGSDLTSKVNADIYHLGLQWTMDDYLYDGESLRLSSYLEGGLGYWKNNVSKGPDASDNGHGNIASLMVTPVLRVQPQGAVAGMTPFAEFGVGAGFLSHASMRKKGSSPLNMGSSFHFEVRGAVGVRFGPGQRYDLSLNFLHYSNGNTTKPNEAAEFYTANLRYWF